MIFSGEGNLTLNTIFPTQPALPETALQDPVVQTSLTSGLENEYSQVERLLAPYHAVSLAEVSGSLLTRTDTKFLLSLPALLDMLPALAADYAVLDIAGHRLFDYHNLYLDSEDFAFFKAHHRGTYARHKLRYRYYQQTDDTFLELKTKDATRRTVKLRERLADTSGAAQTRALEAVRKKIAAPHLVGKLRGHYKRISLVGKRSEERLTLDFDLRFTTPDSGRHVHLQNVAVAELKQPRPSPQSPFAQRARRHGLKRTSISKYCVGCCSLYPQLKHNHFKPVLRDLERLYL